jgi:hypothetical protein
MTNYSYRLTEEISRWAFEISISQSTQWFIAFSNPTAGPWKRLMGRDAYNNSGEVHRFERDEERPDLVLVCDQLQVIIILEAKDSLQKLMPDNQVSKSAAVVGHLASVLSQKSENTFWRERAYYTIVPGLLWGAEELSTQNERRICFEKYQLAIAAEHYQISSLIVGIESQRDRKTHNIVCVAYYHGDATIRPGVTANAVIELLLHP